MLRRAIGTALAVALLSGAAWADVVTLKNGQKVTGWAREEGDKVVVEMALGTVAFCKSDVVSIEPGRTLLHDYKDKADAIKGSKNAKDYVELSKWARENGLNRYVNENLEAALKIEPDNEVANRALGKSMYKGKWTTQDEIRRDQGFVWYKGRWMTTLEQQLVIRKELDAAEAKLYAELEKKRKKEDERQARLQRMQEYYDRLAEEQRLRAWYRTHRRRAYGPFQGYYGDAVPVVDVVGYLQAIGWSFTPTVPAAPPVPTVPAPGAPYRPPGVP